MYTIDQALEVFPDTRREDWRVASEFKHSWSRDVQRLILHKDVIFPAGPETSSSGIVRRGRLDRSAHLGCGIFDNLFLLDKASVGTTDLELHCTERITARDRSKLVLDKAPADVELTLQDNAAVTSTKFVSKWNLDGDAVPKCGTGKAIVRLGGRAYTGPDVTVEATQQNMRIDGTLMQGTWRVPPLVINGTQDELSTTGPDTIYVGCVAFAEADWEDIFEDVGEDNEYTEEEIAEYEAHLRHAFEWLKGMRDRGMVNY